MRRSQERAAAARRRRELRCRAYAAGQERYAMLRYRARMRLFACFMRSLDTAAAPLPLALEMRYASAPRRASCATMRQCLDSRLRALFRQDIFSRSADAAKAQRYARSLCFRGTR